MRKARRLLFVALIPAVLSSTVYAGVKETAHEAKEDVKTAGRKIGEGARDVGHGVASATKAVGHGVASATKAVGHAVADGARTGYHATKHAIHKAVGKDDSAAQSDTASHAN